MKSILVLFCVILGVSSIQELFVPIEYNGCGDSVEKICDNAKFADSSKPVCVQKKDAYLFNNVESWNNGEKFFMDTFEENAAFSIEQFSFSLVGAFCNVEANLKINGVPVAHLSANNGCEMGINFCPSPIVVKTELNESFVNYQFGTVNSFEIEVVSGNVKISKVVVGIQYNNVIESRSATCTALKRPAVLNKQAFSSCKYRNNEDEDHFTCFDIAKLLTKDYFNDYKHLAITVSIIECDNEGSTTCKTIKGDSNWDYAYDYYPDNYEDSDGTTLCLYDGSEVCEGINPETHSCIRFYRILFQNRGCNPIPVKIVIPNGEKAVAAKNCVPSATPNTCGARTSMDQAFWDYTAPDCSYPDNYHFQEKPVTVVSVLPVEAFNPYFYESLIIHGISFSYSLFNGYSKRTHNGPFFPPEDINFDDYTIEMFAVNHDKKKDVSEKKWNFEKLKAANLTRGKEKELSKGESKERSCAKSIEPRSCKKRDIERAINMDNPLFRTVRSGPLHVPANTFAIRDVDFDNDGFYPEGFGLYNDFSICFDKPYEIDYIDEDTYLFVRLTHTGCGKDFDNIDYFLTYNNDNDAFAYIDDKYDSHDGAGGCAGPMTGLSFVDGKDPYICTFKRDLQTSIDEICYFK